MQRIRLILAALAGLLAVPSGLLFGDQTPPPSSPGAALYQQRCFMCHGDGHGNEKMAQMLHVSPGKLDLTKNQDIPAVLENTIRNGRNKMPAYKFVTDSEIKDVAAYAQSLSTVKG